MYLIVAMQALAGAALATLSLATAVQPPPNFVVFFADNLGWGVSASSLCVLLNSPTTSSLPAAGWSPVDQC